MSLPPGFLDELRARVPISRVIGRKVAWDLRKSNQAKGDWWAPCPFHQEKTASFHCDDQKGFYYCFGCHAKGDALGFLREAEGMEFIEAVRHLAAEAGIAMPERDPASQQREGRASQLRAAMEAAVQHYRLQLGTGAASGAREYLRRRGLDAAALERFGIGFAPDTRDGLGAALRAKGMDEGLLIEAGLIARPDDGGPAYDRFRGRIMFPILDARGRPIAFGGRAMDPNARAKYLNSPETPLFDKGRNLYNLGPARAAVSKGARLIVAEGYMDVIALDRAGFGGAVAPLGTAITESQLQLLWRVSPEPVIALDGDTAGLRAAMRLIDMALPMTGPGQALRFALMPAGQDPDDVIRAGGRAQMDKVIAAARPLVDLLWQRATEGQDFDSPERRAALDKTLREEIARIPDETTRRHYAEALRERRYQLFGGRRGAGRLTPAPGARPGGGARKGARGAPPFQSQGVLPQTKISAIAAGAGDDSLLETLILAICARHPGLAARFEAGLERLEPQDPGRAALCHDLLAGSRSARGDEALSRIMDDPYVRLSPLIAQGADAALAGEAMGNLLAQLAARRAARREMARAEAEITGVADEGLTWRARETALARAQAERPGIKGAGAVDEDRAALSARLRAALGGPRLDAPAPGGAEAGTDDEPD